MPHLLTHTLLFIVIYLKKTSKVVSKKCHEEDSDDDFCADDDVPLSSLLRVQDTTNTTKNIPEKYGWVRNIDKIMNIEPFTEETGVQISSLVGKSPVQILPDSSQITCLNTLCTKQIYTQQKNMAPTRHGSGIKCLVVH